MGQSLFWIIFLIAVFNIIRVKSGYVFVSTKKQNMNDQYFMEQQQRQQQQQNEDIKH